MSNLKQVGLGVIQYVQDYDERMPIHGSTTNGNTGDGICDFMNPASTSNPVGGYGSPWATNFLYEIVPYTKSQQILLCPSTMPNASYPATALSANSYVGNGVVLRQTGLAVATIPNTANIVLADESNTFNDLCLVRPAASSALGCYPQYTYWHNNTGSPPTAITETYMNNHFSGANFLYCDGHVKWMIVNSTNPVMFGLANGTSGTVNDTIATPGGVCYTSAF